MRGGEIMLNNWCYISEREYNIMRHNLLSKNKTIVKTTLQELITKYEENETTNLMKECKKDLCAVLYTLVQNEDYKIRKWTYHLIAYVFTNVLIERCILNLKEGLEKDAENITWILALASIIKDQDEVNRLYDTYAKEVISIFQYQMCTAIFADYAIRITYKMVNRILDSEDFLAKMWMTKMYACTYKTAKKKIYTKVINSDVMNELIDQEKIARYGVWAFSTFKNCSVRKIAIPLYDVEKRSTGVQAWFYNCFFKDQETLGRERDYVEDLLRKFPTLPTKIQTGILRGLMATDYSLGYMEGCLAQIYLQLDEEDVRNLPILIALIHTFVNHTERSGEMEKLLSDIQKNTRSNIIRQELMLWNGEDKCMSNKILFNYGTVNQIEKNEGVIINTNNMYKDPAKNLKGEDQIKEILYELKEGKYETEIRGKSAELENMVIKCKYELKQAQKLMQSTEFGTASTKISELADKLDELQRSRESERTGKFSEFLNAFSSICTIFTATPQLFAAGQRIMEFVMEFLKNYKG